MQKHLDLLVSPCKPPCLIKLITFVNIICFNLVLMFMCFVNYSSEINLILYWQQVHCYTSLSWHYLCSLNFVLFTFSEVPSISLPNFKKIASLLGQTSTYGLYYKNTVAVNDTSRVFRMTIVSDTPSCGVSYYHHSDD